MAGFFSSSSLTSKRVSLPTIAQCGRCGLYKSCLSPKMKPSGKGKYKILIVGEAAGENDDRGGRHFTGKTGRCLRGLLNELNYDLEDFYLTNSIICRPTGDKLEEKHLSACRPNLYNTIRELQPKVIILLGDSAIRSLIQPEWRDIDKVEKWVGWKIPNSLHNAWVCPTYDPAFILQKKEDPALVRLVKQHLTAAIALEHVPIHTESLQSLKNQIEVIESPKQAKLRILDLAGKEGELVVDFETSGLKPEKPEHVIFSVSFCLDGKDIFSAKIDESCHDALRAVLTNRKLKKIAQNLKFEHRWGLVKLKCKTENWVWDTMLTAHVLDNRRNITGLKFQTYVNMGIGDHSLRAKGIHLGEEDYHSHVAPFLQSSPEDQKKYGANAVNQIHKAPLRELLFYGGMDAVLEWLLYCRQKEQLKL